MLDPADQIPDTLDDDIGRLLAQFRGAGAGTTAGNAAITRAIQAMTDAGYVTIHGTYKSYSISRIGQSCLYDVPLDRRGNLLPFRGKRVRIVVVSNYGYNGKVIMAGTVV